MTFRSCSSEALVPSGIPIIELTSPETLSLSNKRLLYEELIRKEFDSYLKQYEVVKIAKQAKVCPVSPTTTTTTDSCMASSSFKTSHGDISIASSSMCQQREIENNETNEQNEMINECTRRICQLQRLKFYEQKIATNISAVWNLLVDEPGCHQSKIDAQSLLLLSSHKIAAYCDEIGRLESVIRNPNLPIVKVKLKSTANICLSTIRIPDLNEPNSDYVVIVTHRANVFLSNLGHRYEDLDGLHIEFKFDSNTFEVDSNFLITIRLYSLKKSSQPRGGFFRSLSWRSFRQSSHRSFLKNHPVASGFKLIGYSELNLERLRRLKKLELNLLSCRHDSPPAVPVKINAIWDIVHRYSVKGYYLMRCSTRTTWRLRWIELRNKYLLYWRYEQDQNVLPPLGVIPLLNCVNPSVDIHEVGHHKALTIVTCESRHGYPQSKHLYWISSKSIQLLLDLAREVNCALNSIRLWEDEALAPTEQIDQIISDHK